MGTRSLTFIYAEDETKPTQRIVCMYRQFDGYPSGHGLDLHKFLTSGEMVNGFGDPTAKQFNGMPCLAAQMVAHFKEGVGGFYLYPTNTKDAWQEYEYHVYYINNQFVIKVVKVLAYKTVFSGSLDAFAAWCKED